MVGLPGLTVKEDALVDSIAYRVPLPIDGQRHISQAVEQSEIHQAVCRWRRQGLVCSTCAELTARAARVEAEARP